MSERTNRYVIKISPYKGEENKTLYYIYLYDETGKWIEGTRGWKSSKMAWSQYKMFRDQAKKKTGEEPYVSNWTEYLPAWFDKKNLLTFAQTAQE